MKRSSADYKKLARITLKGKYPLPMAGIVLFTLGMALCYMIAGAITGFTSNNAEDFSILSSVLYLLVVFVITLIASVIGAGLIYMILNLCRGKTVALSDMLYMFKEHPDRVILVSVLLELVMVVCMLPSFIFGLLILLSRSINWAYYLLTIFFSLVGFVAYIAICLPVSLSTYLLVDDHELGAIDALKKSVSLMRGNNARLLYLQLSFMGLIILCPLSFDVGALWVMPYMMVTICLFYLDIIGELDTMPIAQKRPAAPAAEPSPVPAVSPSAVPSAEPSSASSYAPADKSAAVPGVVPPSAPAGESAVEPADEPSYTSADESPAVPGVVPPSAPAGESAVEPADEPSYTSVDESPAVPGVVPPSASVGESAVRPSAEPPIVSVAASPEMPEQASEAEEKVSPKYAESSVQDESSSSDERPADNRPPVSDVESAFPKADWNINDEDGDRDQ